MQDIHLEKLSLLTLSRVKCSVPSLFMGWIAIGFESEQLIANFSKHKPFTRLISCDELTMQDIHWKTLLVNEK